MKILLHTTLLSLCILAYPQRSLASDTEHRWELGISLEQREYVTNRYHAGIAGLPGFPGSLGIFLGSMNFLEGASGRVDSESANTVAAREFGMEYRFQNATNLTQLVRPWGKFQLGRTTYKDHEKRPFRGNNFLAFELGLSLGSKPIDIFLGLGYRLAILPKTDAVPYLGAKPMEQSMVYPSLGFNFLF